MIQTRFFLILAVGLFLSTPKSADAFAMGGTQAQTQAAKIGSETQFGLNSGSMEKACYASGRVYDGYWT